MDYYNDSDDRFKLSRKLSVLLDELKGEKTLTTKRSYYSNEYGRHYATYEIYVDRENQRNYSAGIGAFGLLLIAKQGTGNYDQSKLISFLELTEEEKKWLKVLGKLMRVTKLLNKATKIVSQTMSKKQQLSSDVRRRLKEELPVLHEQLDYLLLRLKTCYPATLAHKKQQLLIQLQEEY